MIYIGKGDEAALKTCTDAGMKVRAWAASRAPGTLGLGGWPVAPRNTQRCPSPSCQRPGGEACRVSPGPLRALLLVYPFCLGEDKPLA